MKSENLNEALDMIIENLYKSDMDTIDKVELMINLKEFLSPKQYDHNIKILKNDKFKERDSIK